MNPFGITSVHLVCEGGSWLSYHDARTGQVCDPKLVADMQQRVEAAGGLPPSVCRSWFSTPEEKAAAAQEPPLMTNIGEKAVSPWIDVFRSDG